MKTMRLTIQHFKSIDPSRLKDLQDGKKCYACHNPLKYLKIKTTGAVTDWCINMHCIAYVKLNMDKFELMDKPPRIINEPK